MLLARLSILAACLLTSGSLVLAAHVHHAPSKATSGSVTALAEAPTTHSRTAYNERRDSGGDKIQSIEYCTDPNFTGHCAMPEVTLNHCMVISDPTYKNSITSFRINDANVRCEGTDPSCLEDIATIEPATPVTDGGYARWAIDKGSVFNDQVLSYLCIRLP
ncbi:hypothetical protein OH76DRAFT_1408113 [Lentinus brumalis]|uniref:Uncharacterized protein n=1 Tax=Lentinus brumalis TaxID=2498619 RepID=A0A371CYG4_9APHY|nr:hypothetical protein OH76DRAFT_1408113 [Polyporus brumalis]